MPENSPSTRVMVISHVSMISALKRRSAGKVTPSTIYVTFIAALVDLRGHGSKAQRSYGWNRIMIVLGKHAHSQLIERRGLEGLKGLLLQGVSLMNPQA